MSDDWIPLDDPPGKCTRVPGSRILTEVNLYQDGVDYYKSLAVTKDGIKQPTSWYRLNDEVRSQMRKHAVNFGGFCGR